MEYNNEAFKNIDTGCPAAANIGLGAIIDAAYAELKSDKKYTGDVLTDAQVEALDKMCSASDITDIAYILNGILTASKSQGTVDELSEETINKINNGICGIFQSCALGTKLEEMIEIVNDASDDTVADFKTFKIGDYVGTVDTTNATVAISVPYGTDVSAATAEFTFVNSKSSAKVGSTEQESGVTTNDFSSPVTYVITAEDGTTTKDYVVTVTELPNTEAKITAYSISNVDGTIDEANGTINLELPYGTDVTDLVANFTLSAEATAKVGDTEQTSGTTTNNFTNPITYVVTAEDGTTTKNYVVTVTELANTEAKITAYSISSVDGTIDETNHTIALELPHGTDVTALAATFTLSAQATAKVGDDAQTSGTTENDFTNPVTYTIIAGDEETTQNYVVTVTVAEEVQEPSEEPGE